ncbi:putative acyl-coenzyme A synthetase [Cladophialophora carrionii]|uniref:Putative acyl-coenzyme A synthetase n=1 Tax=Cladophialophora carrionii TaxID=86049 RepID=A0A1C1CSP2_9EURO|nr:putative acyl-coenzyme A synthetase [Cladophialophora carrionii]
MARIYRNPTRPVVDVPKLDLLTLLFESEYSAAQDDTVLHLEATNPSNKITKSDLRDLTQQIAHGLRQHYGVGANGPNKDVVTVISYGQPMVPAAFYGTIAAGGVYSAASPSSTVADLSRQITVGTSRLIVCGSEHKDVATQAAKQCNLPLDRVLVLESGPSWSLKSLDGKVNVISNEKLKWPRITDPATLTKSLIVILWSSGTTGLPKGVMLSHENLVQELYLVSLPGREWAAKQIEAGKELKPYRTLAHLPISHIAGLFGYLVAPFYAGGLVVWMRKYEWSQMLRFVKEYEITAFYTVPSIYLRISKSPEVKDHFKTVDAASTGAAPMDEDLQKAANSKLGQGETFIGQTWGLSETTGAVTMMPRGESDTTGSISPILPNVEIRMVDDNFNDVEPGQEGELLVRSPLVTQGYFNNPQATKEAFHDGWFCTGDIGVLRNGKFYIVDRKKELLKYKGLQVAPAEIENLLFTHPKIQEAAVVGVNLPDDPGTDLPRAYVVADPAQVSEQEIKDFVKERLAPYKQLRGGVVFVNELPKNAIGKFLRRELRDRAKRELGLTKTSKL